MKNMNMKRKMKEKLKKKKKISNNNKNKYSSSHSNKNSNNYNMVHNYLHSTNKMPNKEYHNNQDQVIIKINKVIIKKKKELRMMINIKITKEMIMNE